MNLPDPLDGWWALIDQHLLRYPLMSAQDVYKLLFQGVLGPEHIMPSAEIFAARLQDELDSLEPDVGQPLVEDIRPDRTLGRIYLRPWLTMGQDVSALITACLETARQSWGTPEQLRRLWYAFEYQVESEIFPSLPVDEVHALSRLLEQNNFPAVHHSDAYEAHYRPAYRLVATLAE